MNDELFLLQNKFFEEMKKVRPGGRLSAELNWDKEAEECLKQMKTVLARMTKTDERYALYRPVVEHKRGKPSFAYFLVAKPLDESILI